MAALARQLARRHEVTVLTSRAGDLAAESDDQGVHVVRVPVFFRRQLAVANFPSMLAYLPSGFARGLSLRRAGLRRDQHALRRADRTAGSRARALASPAERAVGARRRSVRSEQAPLAASACAAASRRALDARGSRRGRRPVTRYRATRQRALWRAPRRRTDSARDRASADASRGVARNLRPAARCVRHGHDRSTGRAQGDDAAGRRAGRERDSQCAPADRRRRSGCRSDSRSARPSSASRSACTCRDRSRRRTSTPRSPSPMRSSRPASTKASAWCSWKRWPAACRSSVTTAAGRPTS